MKKKKQQEPTTKKKEQLSTRDIKELMGMNKDRYERRRGAVRRK